MKTLTKVLALSCLIALVIGVTSVQAADMYGALAYSPETGRMGSSIDYPTQAEAEQAALSQCGANDCKAYNWFRNSCGAMARGGNGDLGWAWGLAQQDADAKAIEQCRSVSGQDCRVIIHACTSTIAPAQ